MEKYYIPLLFLAVVVLVLFSKFYRGGSLLLPQANNQATESGVVGSFPTVDQNANWNTYSNNKYNFSLKYPLDKTVCEKDTHLEIVNVNIPCSNINEYSDVIDIAIYIVPHGESIKNDSGLYGVTHWNSHGVTDTNQVSGGLITRTISGVAMGSSRRFTILIASFPNTNLDLHLESDYSTDEGAKLTRDIFSTFKFL